MLSPALHAALEHAIKDALGHSFRLAHAELINRDGLNSALRLDGPADSVFVKLCPAPEQAMFSAETDGLRALARCESLKVPSILTTGTAENHAYLILEWLDIRPVSDDATARRAGEALAALHRCKGEHFGWPHDNFIGATPQCNQETDNWSRFFVQQRLAPQFKRAASKGFGGELQKHAEIITGKAPALFLEYRPSPSLLHGDLWSGNLGALPDGQPVLFDPACYMGDRETDLAMTELFGGLPLAFYSAYRDAWPLDDGYELRKPLYNLYHILNHLNLFGRGYLRQAERMAAGLANLLSR